MLYRSCGRICLPSQYDTACAAFVAKTSLNVEYYVKFPYAATKQPPGPVLRGSVTVTICKLEGIDQ